MGFKGFYFRLALRIFILALIIFALSYSLLQQFYLRSVYMGVFAMISGIELTFFVSGYAKKIKIMHESILDRDFGVRLDSNKSQYPFDDSFRAVNRIAELFKTIGAEKEIQHRYLETLVNHVNIGLISFREDGSVFLVNSAFYNLLGIDSIKDLSGLKVVSDELVEKITILNSSRTELMKIRRENRLTNLALSASEFKLDDKLYKLISVQDITNELSVTEMEAWQKLIRVLTHEIMNSVSPIISLSGTLNKLASRSPSDYSEKDWETFRAGLSAIQNRGEGLQVFTRRYRELTHIPSPDFKKSNITQLIDRTLDLLWGDLNNLGIAVSNTCEHAEIFMDAKLIEQVLINILRNAIDAIGTMNNPSITVSGAIRDNKYLIEIADNGPGIVDSEMEKIFVPFYTTKTAGSGIGLSFARQVVLMHRGEIFANRNHWGGTTISILF